MHASLFTYLFYIVIYTHLFYKNPFDMTIIRLKHTEIKNYALAEIPQYIFLSPNIDSTILTI